jgi:hypothetical protein
MFEVSWGNVLKERSNNINDYTHPQFLLTDGTKMSGRDSTSIRYWKP